MKIELDFTTADYIRGILWMVCVFGPGIVIILLMLYAFFA